jgi:hypothetical protein
MAGLVMAAALIGARTIRTRARASAPAAVTPRIADTAAATTLAFPELLEPGPKLRPSPKALALNGKRTRIVGFMAETEEPMAGAFYLVSHPTHLDESGGGTGDLPLDSVLIAVPGAEGKAIPYVEGALEGVGVLEVGNRADQHGRVSNFRLRLDPDKRLMPASVAVTATASN